MAKNLCEVCGHYVQVDGMLECEECLNEMATDYEAEDWYQQMGCDKPSSPEFNDPINPEWD